MSNIDFSNTCLEPGLAIPTLTKAFPHLEAQIIGCDQIFSPSNDNAFLAALRAAFISSMDSFGENTEDVFFALKG